MGLFIYERCSRGITISYILYKSIVYDILFVLFDVEFNCISESASINENT